MIDHENHAEWEFLVQLQMQQHCDRQKRIDRVFRYLKKNWNVFGNFSFKNEASGEVLLRSKNDQNSEENLKSLVPYTKSMKHLNFRAKNHIEIPWL